MADEFVDVLDEHGVLTGQQILKSVAHQDGIWHLGAHVWIYNDKGELLLQKRAATKLLYPGLWDISAAGHVAAGEDPSVSAARELFEEIGKNVSLSQLRKQFIIKVVHDVDGMRIREFCHVYTWYCNDDIATFSRQEEEVDELKFISLQQLKTDIDSFYVRNYVPHGEYYDRILAVIEEELKQLKKII